MKRIKRVIAGSVAGSMVAMAAQAEPGEQSRTLVPDPPEFDGDRAEAVVKMDETLTFDREITVEAWVDAEVSPAEVFQPLVSIWNPLADMETFDAYDAGQTSGLETKGFLGAVFDGRYVYFSPQHDSERRHGRPLRYDTHGAFTNPASWQGFDAENIGDLDTKGYYGAIFDGRHVYFVPRVSDGGFHTRVLRYDTRQTFDDRSAWEAYDAGLNISYQSGAFDGRYVYFAPGTGRERGHEGRVLRYDTQAPFAEQASWETYDAGTTGGLTTKDFDGAAFDGRYIYFAPLSYGAPLRYDTTRPFGEPASWSAFDASPLGMQRTVGIVFDGRYLYFCAYDQHVMIRYDTKKEFEDAGGWERYEVKRTKGLRHAGYDGGFFDGRYVYFVPFLDHEPGIEGKRIHFHAELLRYDTQGAFTHPASWRSRDVSRTSGLHTVGYNAGAFDGRYFYFAPWQDGVAYAETRAISGHGRVLRYDTLGDQGTFSLRFCDYGHNGGLNGALPGPRFLVNTEAGVRSVAGNAVLSPGRRHLVGVYDGQTIRLYIDGSLINEQSASGAIVNSGMPLAVGRIENGSGFFKGRIHEVSVANVARDAAWVAARYGRLLEEDGGKQP